MKYAYSEKAYRELFETTQTLKESTMNGAEGVLVELSSGFSQETGELFEISVDGLLFTETSNHLHALFIFNMLVEHGAEYSLQVL